MIDIEFFVSALPKTRKITLDEFELLPEFDGIQELLDGEVVEMPPPKQRHSVLVKRIAEILRLHVDDSRVWVETGFVIGKHCLQPDLAVSHPDQPLERGWFSGAPLIAVEVASRGNTPDELEFKKELYLSNGAREVWVIYDKTRKVEWYGSSGLYRTYRGLFRSEALAADIEVSEIFE